eukprot:9503850-Pyramimonas_sp.AAC.1
MLNIEQNLYLNDFNLAEAPDQWGEDQWAGPIPMSSNIVTHVGTSPTAPIPPVAIPHNPSEDPAPLAPL